MSESIWVGDDDSGFSDATVESYFSDGWNVADDTVPDIRYPFVTVGNFAPKGLSPLEHFRWANFQFQF